MRNFGLFLSQQREVERGRAMIEQNLATYERLSKVYSRGQCHAYLASIEEDAGNSVAEISHYREALTRFEQLQSRTRRTLRRLGAEP